MRRYRLNVTYGTKEWMDEQSIIDEYGSIDNFKEFALSQANELLPSKIEQAFQEQGVTVTFLELISTKIAWERSLWDNSHYKRKLYYVCLCEIETESAFFESPIAPLVIVAIGFAIALIVAAFVVPPYFFAWLESMTTRQWEVEEYEWVENPETGEWEWKKTKVESGSSADPIGIGGLVIVLGIAMLLIFLFAGGLGKIRKK